MSNIFYVRDNHYNGKIHRVKYNHDDKTVEITDHENPVNEMACREFGYEIDSACLDFEELARHSITAALTSIKVFPGSILIRIAAAWARGMAGRLDEKIQQAYRYSMRLGRKLQLENGESFSAVNSLDMTLKYLERYLDSSRPWPVDDDGEFSVEDDVSRMIPNGVFWEVETLCIQDTHLVYASRAVEDLVMACGWYPPIGRQANRSSEVEEKVASSVNHTLAAINRWFEHLQNTEQLDEFEVMFRRAAMFNRMLREAAAITKKHQGEL